MIFTDKYYQESHLASFRRMSVEMRTCCVEAVRELYAEYENMQKDKEFIISEIQKNPYTWWAQYHMFWGMSMRNFLRGYYTDDQLPSTLYDDDRGEYKNWDDYYIAIVEVAFEEGIYHLLNEAEKV